jgi:hypothetical protein
MDHHEHPAIFIADSPGLDFLNSVATLEDRPVDGIVSVRSSTSLKPGEPSR